MSTKTNFVDWAVHYEPVLYPYYLDFIQMFPKNEEPTLKDFMKHCFVNTKQYYNQSKMIYEAKIYRDY